MCILNGTATLEKVWQYLKKVYTDFPYDPAIPLGIYPRKMKSVFSQRHIVNVGSNIVYNS